MKDLIYALAVMAVGYLFVAMLLGGCATAPTRQQQQICWSYLTTAERGAYTEDQVTEACAAVIGSVSR